jgi:circadian clock protein KaiC
MAQEPSQSATVLAPPTVSTGIAGLDEVLRGGLPSGQMYLITGDAGSGKTTLTLQFLLAGVALGERVLYISLSETISEVEEIAKSHAWSLQGVKLEEIIPNERADNATEQTVFKASELELNEFRSRLEAVVERADPQRAVIDSLSELRLLAGDSRQYRKQVASIKRYFLERDCTLLVTDDNTSEEPLALLHSLAHGVLALSRVPRVFGAPRRKVEVLKVRARSFIEGCHDYAILTGAIVVYPRLVAPAQRGVSTPDKIVSGILALDTLVGGGINRGTSVALVGPSGIGKSMTALQYVLHNLSLGAKSAIFLFDESLRTLQLSAIGAKLVPHIASGQVHVDQIDPAELSPGEFTARVRVAVDEGAEIVVIDGLNGYLNAMPGEQLLLLHLHELLAYLKASNVTVFLVVNRPGELAADGNGMLDVSYLTDTVLLYRNFEHEGQVHSAISVLKHRGAPMERTLRELSLTPEGIRVGKALNDFRGVLTGTPWLKDQHDRPTG